MRYCVEIRVYRYFQIQVVCTIPCILCKCRGDRLHCFVQMITGGILVYLVAREVGLVVLGIQKGFINLNFSL